MKVFPADKASRRNELFIVGTLLGVIVAFTLIIASLFNLSSDKSSIPVNALSESAPLAAPTPLADVDYPKLKLMAQNLISLSVSKTKEYKTEDLKEYDNVRALLKKIDKKNKNYNEAQILDKKVGAIAITIGAEIVVLGDKPKGDGRTAVRQYLRQVLNDYNNSEFIQWTEPQKVYDGEEPYWAVGLRLRAKNGFGGVVLRDVVFLIRNDRVVRAEGL